MLEKRGANLVPRVRVWFFSEIILSTNLYQIQLCKVGLF
jgi:hypothetical protein